MKRVASIQDISCLGRCSITAALPVLSAMSVECTVIPTAVLSAHTEFSGVVCRDLTDHILPVARHWQSQGIALDAVYTGYMATPEQAEQISRAYDLLRGKNTMLFVDPAMADHGKLYAPFRPDFPDSMVKMCRRADVVIPNLTEACLLTHTPYREDFGEEEIRTLLRKLTELGAGCAAITGVSLRPHELGVMSYDRARDRFFSYYNEKIPVHYSGTGDIFASVTVGGVMRGLSLEDALSLAVDFVLECIRITCSDPTAPRYGVEFERALPLLWDRLGPL